MKYISGPLTSVIIPTGDNAFQLAELLSCLMNQTLPVDELIIVDSNSTDTTRKVAFSYPHLPVRVLNNPNKNKASSLNMALEICKGEIIFFMDDNMKVDSKFIEIAVSHFRISPDLGAVGGVQDLYGTTFAGNTITEVLGSSITQSPFVQPHRYEPAYTKRVAYGAYRKKTLMEIGGWNEQLKENYSIDLDYRIYSSGKLLLFDPNMKASCRSKSSINEHITMFTNLGKDKSKMRPTSLINFTPLLLAISFLLLTVLGATVSIVLAALPTMVYLTFATALTAQLKFPTHRQYFLAFKIIVTMHCAYVYGMGSELFCSILTQINTTTSPSSADSNI